MSSVIQYYAHVTIKGIGNNCRGKITLNNKTVSVVQFVGQVKAIKINSNNIYYLIEDSTGTVDAINYDSVGDQAHINRHYKIRGSLHYMDGNISVCIKEMHVILDFRDIIEHIFKVSFSPVDELPLRYYSQDGTTWLPNDSSNKVNRTSMRIFNVIDNDRSPDGVHIFEIYKRTPTECLESLKESLEYLRDIGHIHTTDLIYYKSIN